MTDKPRIYLDNCCFNRPFDDQSQLIVRLESEAVLFVEEQIRRKNVELVWSFILESENDANTDYQKRTAIGIWRYAASTVVAPSTDILQKAIMIEKKGLKPMDALHIACAVHVSADCFITTDQGIIKKNIVDIPVLNPIDFVRLIKEIKQ